MTGDTVLISRDFFQAMCDKPMTKSAQKVLFLLAEQADDRNKVAAEIAPIAREVGISHSTATRAVATLIERDMIRALPNLMTPKAPIYFINPWMVFRGDESLLDEALEEYDALQ